MGNRKIQRQSNQLHGPAISLKAGGRSGRPQNDTVRLCFELKKKTHIVLHVVLGKLGGVSARRHDRRDGVLVEVLHKDGLAEGGLVVLP